MASLRGAINDSQTEIQVDDTTSFPTNGGVVLVETELIRYTYATDKAILGCERGFNATTPADHADKTALEIQDTTAPLYGLQEYSDHGTPMDHLTGVGFALKGSRYTDLDTATVYLNTSDETDPIWVAMGSGSGGSASGPNGAVQLSDGAGGFINDPMFAWRESDNTLRLGTAAEGVALSLTNTSGAYIYFADEDVTASTARIVSEGPTGDLVVKNQAGSADVRLESEKDITLTTPAGAVRTTHITNRADGANLLIDETQGANIQIRNENGSGGTVGVTSDADLTLVSNTGAVVQQAVTEVLMDINGGNTQHHFTDSGFNLSNSVFVLDDSENNIIFSGLNGAHYTTIDLKAATSNWIQFRAGDGDTLARINCGPADGAGDLDISLFHDGVEMKLSANNNALLVLNDSAHGYDGSATLNANSNGSVRIKQGGSLVWEFDNAGTLTTPGAIDLATTLNVQDAGLIRQSSTFTNLYLEGPTGIELIPSNPNTGVFISHSTGGADASASMHFETAGQGVILPRMDTATRDAIASPAEGLIIYNYTTHVLNFYNGTVWAAV